MKAVTSSVLVQQIIIRADWVSYRIVGHKSVSCSKRSDHDSHYIYLLHGAVYLHTKMT